MPSNRSRLPGALGFFLIACVVCSSPSPSISASPANALTIEGFFFPRGGATETVIHETGNAKQAVLFQPYAWGLAVAGMGIVHGKSQSHILQAGLVEYALILTNSVGNIFTYGWLTQNKTAVAILGFIILVLLYLVFIY